MQGFFTKTKGIIVQSLAYIMLHIKQCGLQLVIQMKEKYGSISLSSNHLFHGYWFNPAHPEKSPGLLEHFRLPLRQLYTHSVKTDYELIEINENIVKNMIVMVDDVIKTILSKGGK